MRPVPLTFYAAIPLLLLSACRSESEVPAQPEPTASASTEATSILRPDVEVPEEVIAPVESFETTIGFPEGGGDLDPNAIDMLEMVAASEQFALSTPIILRAHSDSAGSDAANARAAEERGLAVAEWLIEAGAASERIEVIVFGEQNPIEPNALPDGMPNEAGRAANRRVEIEILPRAPEAQQATVPQNAGSRGTGPNGTGPQEEPLEPSDES